MPLENLQPFHVHSKTTNRVLKNDTPPSLGFAQGTCGFSMPYKNMREGSLCYVRVLQVPQVAHPPCVFLYYHTMKRTNNSIKAFAMAAIATMFSMSIASCDDDDVLPDTQKVEDPETTDTPIPASVSFETKGDGDGSVTSLSGDTFYVGDTISVSVNVADQNSELAMDGVNVLGGRILSNKDNTYTIVLDAENASVYATFNKIKTYGFVVNEKSMEVAFQHGHGSISSASEMYNANHMEIVGGKTEVRKGDSFSVKFNLFNSYVVKSVKVNGVDMTSNVKDNVLNVDVNNDIVNGKDDITIDAVYDMNLTFKVTAEFTNKEKTEVKYHITPSVEGVMYFGHAVKHSAWVNTNILGDNDIVNVDVISNMFLTSELKFGSVTVTRSYAVADDYILIVCRLNKDNEVIGDVLVYHMNDLLGIK